VLLLLPVAPHLLKAGHKSAIRQLRVHCRLPQGGKLA
jgi:hypothetical protein